MDLDLEPELWFWYWYWLWGLLKKNGEVSQCVWGIGLEMGVRVRAKGSWVKKGKGSGCGKKKRWVTDDMAATVILSFLLNSRSGSFRPNASQSPCNPVELDA